jgi:hypothetical protein
VLRLWVEGALAGYKVELTDADYVHAPERSPQIADGVREWAIAQRSNERLTEEERHGQVDALWDAMNEPAEPDEYPRPPRSRVSLAESRAAKKLGVLPLELQQRAIGLWGRSIEAEALSRAGTESTPQARGRVTRLLVGEIRESMKEGR